MRGFPAILGVVMLAAFLLTTAATAVDAQDEPVPRLPTRLNVKVGGATGSMSSVGYYLAMQKGYFEEANITNEWLTLPSHIQLLPPLATGELNVGSMGPNAALFNAIERGVKLRIVADQNTAFPGRSSIAVLVRRDLVESGQVKTPADLKGRTIALAARRATMELDLVRLLKQGGLTLDDINLVTMSFPSMTTAFANKTIDAGFSLEPLVTATVTRGVAIKWKSLDEITPYRQNGFLLMSERFAANTEAARAWMVAYVRGLRDYNDAITKGVGREALVEALMKHTPVKDRAVYDRMSFPGIHHDGELQVESIREAYRDFLAAGDIKRELDIDAYIDLSFIQYARKVLGPYRP